MIQQRDNLTSEIGGLVLSISEKLREINEANQELQTIKQES